jgi:DNA-binding protein H-NS
MENSQFRNMPLEELWELHAQLSQILADRLVEERKRLEARLKKIQRPQQRTFAAVQYRNPSNPSETWVGHGRRPRWVIELLRSGKRLDELKGGDL